MTIKKQIIGHRGAAAVAPENTIAAFKKAHAHECRFIEFDVMLSQDGEAFICHDESLPRTTNGAGDIGLVTAEYIQSLDAGGWFSDEFRGEKVPTLHDALLWLSTTDMHANIEIKPYKDRVEETTLTVLTHIKQYWPTTKDLPLVSSFAQGALRICKDKFPELPLGLLQHRWQQDWHRQADELSCLSVHLNKRIVTEKRVKEIKARGYQVYVYTVNNQIMAKKLLSWGVDAVFSDYPSLL